jgi:DNA polymerase I
MIVDLSEFGKVIEELSQSDTLSIDTETTGLRPYHSDKIFAIIIGSSQNQYYFRYPLSPENKQLVKLLFLDKSKTWFIHNAKFDLAMLAKEDLHLAGTVHCTWAIARLEYNEHMSYSLSECAKRLNKKKSDLADWYIKRYKLWEWKTIPGKKARRKNLFFNQLPERIIHKYGEKDAEITYAVGRHQQQRLEGLDYGLPPGMPTLQSLCANERKLTKTVFEIEQVGIKIDSGYCMSASRHEALRATKAIADFKKETGQDFVDSSKALQSVFSSERALWKLTPKGNPSFDSNSLKLFTNPAAKIVLEYRDAKSRSDFYNGFIYHADINSVVHPNFNTSGTSTGRFSSSDPNFQNLTKEEGEAKYKIRNAIIPREGYSFVELDYKAMEFRAMVDYAGDEVLAEKIKEGHDPHQATADMVGISRRQAKTLNFALLYGMGADKLKYSLDLPSTDAAKILKEKYFSALPLVKSLLNNVTNKAKARGFIFNRFGRRCWFPNREFAYKAPNYLIQGSCGDTLKFAMNNIHDYLKDYKSRMVLTVHDSILLEVAHGEEGIVSDIVDIMEEAYPHKILPMECSLEASDKSWGDIE